LRPKIYSPESDFQARREKEILSVQYFSLQQIPPSPAEPDEEGYQPPITPKLVPLDKAGVMTSLQSNVVVPQIAQIQTASINAQIPAYLAALLAQQPIPTQPLMTSWNALPTSLPNQMPNIPIPSVFQQAKFQPYSSNRGQPPIASKSRPGNPKPYHGKK
jgi:hypothetical protein